jgi:predicted AAA+ superfamily ATPase
MDLLETLYENKINFPPIFERKIKIEERYTLLYGPKFCGKTFLIYDYLEQNKDKEYLYIDLDDLRNHNDINNLQEFIKEKNIKILVIENYHEKIQLPKVESIVLSSNKLIDINEFHNLKILPLDFEEYILFDTKHQNTTNSFNSFLKFGNLPEIIEYKEFKKHQRNDEIIKLQSDNPTIIAIIKLLIKSLGQNKSPYWLFNILKQEMKISKDFFYKTFKELEDSHTLISCPKYNQPRAVKKIYFYNYALIDNVTYQKNFANVFSNMIFLELYHTNENIFYLDGIDFYLPDTNSIIITMPFFNQFFLSSITSKIIKAMEENTIENITIVTVSNSETMYIENLECEVLPFYEWALGI